MDQPQRYERHYSEADFWAKLASSALAAGQETVRKALTLYFTARAATTPTWAKAIIFGALGYFILPFDAIPDFVPLLGYSDDLGMISAAALAVAAFMKPDHREQAEAMLTRWFGDLTRKLAGGPLPPPAPKG
jgi:uncharacterized membrane protein YkvA (DUF1232 family)